MKRYADEPGADAVRAVPLLVVCALARVEVPAALWRTSRTAELDDDAAAVLAQAFEGEWHDPAGPFVPVAVRAPVLERATALVAAHALRAYDAVQLGCAVAARAVDPQIDTFLCFDVELRRAAVREGFAATL